MNPFLKIKGLEKTYLDGTRAVKGLNLDISPGEFIVLLGPSGCGKTTTLRMLAGLEIPSQGRVEQEGRDVTGLRPAARDIGFVFQFYALYPHMTVLENLLFPLLNSGWMRPRALDRAQDTARQLGLDPLLGRHPRTLSGGDQQRVGLARAMVRKPSLYLMDEPLGTLDAGLRAETRDFLKKRQAEDKVTTIYVTHDQEEAMALADRIVVMEGGRIRQAAAPDVVYHNPADLFVANFVGSPGMNIIKSQKQFPVSGSPFPVPGKNDVVLGIRPEFLRVDPRGDIEAKVIHEAPFGSYRLLYAEGPSGRLVVRTGSGERHKPGSPVRLTLDPLGLRRFDQATGRAL